MLDQKQPERMIAGRTNGLTFRAPKPNPIVKWVSRYFVLPTVRDSYFNKLSVYLSDSSKARLLSKRGERCLILPNHPAQWDPVVMFDISCQVNEPFFYVVAREVFNGFRTFQGWWLQRLGCYSVVRGASDTDSFKMTKDILKRNRGRLVIFVEGEVSRQNDSLLPLEPGVIHLGFLSLLDLYREAEKSIEKTPSLFVMPIAIKYFYDLKGLDKTIAQALSSLEKATGLEKNIRLGFYDRIVALQETILNQTAQQHYFSLNTVQPISEQVGRLVNEMLEGIEKAVDIPQNPSQSYLERVRAIRNNIDLILNDKPESMTDYQKQMYEHQKSLLEGYYWDLERIVNLVGIFDSPLDPNLPPERYVEVIRRLEKEVFKAYQLVHPRTAVVKVLDPIDLKAHLPAYLSDKKATVELLIRDIETALYHGLKTARLPKRDLAKRLARMPKITWFQKKSHLESQEPHPLQSTQ